MFPPAAVRDTILLDNWLLIPLATHPDRGFLPGRRERGWIEFPSFHPDVGAIVCENQNIAPYAVALNARLRIPIFTVYTFVTFFQAASRRRLQLPKVVQPQHMARKMIGEGEEKDGRRPSVVTSFPCL
jgi:hypothetical protein